MQSNVGSERIDISLDPLPISALWRQLLAHFVFAEDIAIIGLLAPAIAAARMP